MKAILENDKCYSCVSHSIGASFNTDGKRRDRIDVEEARGCFDFTIEKHQSCTADGRPIAKQWHLRRSDDDAIIPTRGLGDEFRPVQHLQVFDYIVNDLMPQVPEMKLETVGTLHGGGTGIVMAKFGDDFGIPGDKSPHESRLFFINPNGRSSLMMGFTNVRLWCQNQLPAAIRTTNESVKGGDGFRVAHTTNAEIKVDNAVQVIYDQLHAVRHLKMREERLAEIEATEANLHHLLNKLFPLSGFEEGTVGHTRMLNQREAVTRQWESGETAVSFEGDSAAKLLNCFTYPVYNPSSVGKGTDLAQITFAGTVGSRADKVRKLLDAVEEEVGASAA